MSTAIATQPYDVHQTAKTLRVIRDELGEMFYERTPMIEAMLLALLCREHTYTLGQVGTGKSDASRELASRLTGARYYETALSRTRPDAAVMGPYDLPLLERTGEFRRKIEGYLLTCDIAFLDEVGKMSATLGHELLAALNERLRHEVTETGSWHRIPLHTAFTASNELLGSEDDVLALWDRLLIRCKVDYIGDESTFTRFLLAAVGDTDRDVPRTTIPWAEVAAASAVVPHIPVPDEIAEAMTALRRALAEQGITASDRRWRRSVRVVQARAVLYGREAVTFPDLAGLDYTLWNTPEDIPKVFRTRAKVSDPLADKAIGVMDTLTELIEGINERKGKALRERGGFGAEALATLDVLRRDELEPLKKKYVARDGDASAVQGLEAEVKRVVQLIRVVCLDQKDVDEGTALF